MVSEKGKHNSYTTPPPKLPPKILGRKLIYKPRAKGSVQKGENCFFLPPPPPSPKPTRPLFSYKNLYIYPGKKDGYIWRKMKKLNTPPMLPKNTAHDSFAYGLFFDGGSGNPTIILTYPPPTS